MDDLQIHNSQLTNTGIWDTLFHCGRVWKSSHGLAGFGMIVIGIEGGAKSKIGKARFWVRGLAISPPKISSFERERSG